MASFLAEFLIFPRQGGHSDDHDHDADDHAHDHDCGGDLTKKVVMKMMTTEIMLITKEKQRHLSWSQT